jgi:uncharacterized integral membrane protein
MTEKTNSDRRRENGVLIVILGIIVIVLVALFSVQNAMPVIISFLAWRFEASLAIITLLFFLGGMLTGMGASTWIQMRGKAKRSHEPVGKTPEDKGSAEDLH